MIVTKTSPEDKLLRRAVGQQLRDAAHDVLALHRGRTLLRARRAFLEILVAGPGTATIDQVHEQVSLPSGVNPTVFGATPKPFVRSGIIAPDGFCVTSRPEAHARPIRRWRLVNRPAALEWLRANPDPEHSQRHGEQILLPLVEGAA